MNDTLRNKDLFEFLTPEAMSVLGVVDTFLLHESANESPRGHERYHPSAFGRCLRLMQYQRYEERGWIKSPKQIHNPALCRIFGNGHSMHDRWRAYFEKLGVLKGYWQCNNIACSIYSENSIAEDGFREMQEDPAPFNKKRRWYGKDQLQGCFKPEILPITKSM